MSYLFFINIISYFLLYFNYFLYYIIFNLYLYHIIILYLIFIYIHVIFVCYSSVSSKAFQGIEAHLKGAIIQGEETRQNRRAGPIVKTLKNSFYHFLFRPFGKREKENPISTLEEIHGSEAQREAKSGSITLAASSPYRRSFHFTQQTHPTIRIHTSRQSCKSRSISFIILFPFSKSVTSDEFKFICLILNLRSSVSCAGR